MLASLNDLLVMTCANSISATRLIGMNSTLHFAALFVVFNMFVERHFDQR
jgi:hypothetical protein